jgi:BirA family biotin operon repressor/biotin-[acetyl-CoA-carboxylase] ligase
MTEAADRLAREEIGPWTTIIARHQTQGRGRRDRRWEAASGDALLATVVVPLEIPPERIGLIALATGLAIADAISEWTVPVSLKWPNDIYLDERKLGGVLIHTRLDATVTAMIGIGINLRSAPESQASSAICLAETLAEVPSPRDLAEAIVRRLRARLDQLETRMWQVIIEDWTARALWIGQTVSVQSRELVDGHFAGVDEFGRMLVETAGHVDAISEGDVQRGPRPSLYLDMK